MDQKLNKLYSEYINELNKIGINILEEKKYGKIDISISKGNNKRYGCYKQENPDVLNIEAYLKYLDINSNIMS